MDYKDMIAELGQEIAAALLEEEYNQFVRGLDKPAAPYYPFDSCDCYTDFIETIGHGKVKANYEILYRMEEGI